MKAAMMRESERRGGLNRGEVRAMFRIEPAKAQRVHDLLLACGMPVYGGGALPFLQYSLTLSGALPFLTML